MTSWLHVDRQKPSQTEPKVRPYFFSLDNGEFCSQFNNFFYNYMYSRSNSRDLVIYDRSSPISPVYALLEETFAPLNSLTYSTEMKAGATILRSRDRGRISPLLTPLSMQELRSQAQAVLVWNDKMLTSIKSVCKQNNLEEPVSYDLGLHITSLAAIRSYLDAAEDLAKKLKVPDLKVFIMATDSTYIDEFRRLCPKTWKVSKISGSGDLRGSSITSFSRQPVATKIRAYVEYLTELYCMQNCKNVICNLSNDVGRFLYMTSNTNTFKSMDVPSWTPF